jgi:hypothetical protein
VGFEPVIFGFASSPKKPTQVGFFVAMKRLIDKEWGAPHNPAIPIFTDQISLC